MPHCVIECPVELREIVDFDILVKAVHDATEASGLFEKGDVKSRLVLARHYVVGGERVPYVHVIAHLLSGRSTEQKQALSKSIAATLCELLPTVEWLSVDVKDIDRATYSNRKSLLNQ